MTEYFAHSPKKTFPAQTYKAHVEGVLSRAKQFSAKTAKYAVLDGGLLVHFAQIAAVYHDLGKLDNKNQDILSGQQSAKFLPINHVDAGAAYLMRDESLSILPAIAVASHHGGLPDFIEEQTHEDFAFRDTRIKQNIDSILPELLCLHNSLVKPPPVLEDKYPEGNQSVFLRILLSCLVDADHTDTAINYGNYPIHEQHPKLRPAERLAALDKYVVGLEDSASECDRLRERNKLRSGMYIACKNTVIHEKIAPCDSPVGSGKTTAVMAHLLIQAQKHKLRRIFVILPFTNIIEQSIDIYREALVLPGENPNDVVAELHHRADFESVNARHLTALWRAPIIVTTAVTFFETLASNRPATLRRLHELPGSAIFVDEAHAALPAKLLSIAWHWINVYANDWSCYWLLASGSLSRFWEIEEISPNKATVPEIVPALFRTSLVRFEKSRATYAHKLSPMQIAEFADWSSKMPGPRLIITNTVQTAAVLAKYFSDNFGGEQCVKHLSTALKPSDRQKTLKSIKQRLQNKNDKDWTLIATSCVEAGVDLSFHTGFRELASLTSLLQASGRVNRNGEYSDAKMWTFCLVENKTLKSNPEIENAASVLRDYLECGAKISPELTTQAIEKEIKLYGMNAIHKKLVKSEKSGRFPYIAEKFKVIESNTKIAIVDDDMANNILDGRNIDWRELQKNSVQIVLDKLEKYRAPHLMDDIYHWNLGYNDFLGYMHGIIKITEFENKALISDDL